MPETDAPKMEVIKFAVPAALLREALELAELEGWKQAELHRVLWTMGFAAYVEGSNARMVNKQLRQSFKEIEESDQGG